MEPFYLIALSIALIALIIILTYVGMQMSYYRDKDTTYPPVVSSCPDFWKVSEDEPTKCVIPNADANGVQNIGSMYGANNEILLNSNNTPGLNLQKKSVDFTSSDWGIGGNAICKKQVWANQNGLVWDGVTNYNSC